MSRRSIAPIIVFLSLTISAFSRQPRADSVVLVIPYSTTITNKQIDSLNNRAKELPFGEPDGVLRYAMTAFRHAGKNKYQQGEAVALLFITKAYYTKGEYEKSLDAALDAHTISTRIGYENGEAGALNNIGLIYLAQEDFRQAIEEFKRSLAISEKINDLEMQSRSNFNLGICYDELDQPVVAVKYLQKALTLTKQTKNLQIETMALNRLGETYLNQGEHNRAIAAYRKVIDNKAYQNNWENSFAYTGIGEALLAKGDLNNAISNGREGLRYARIVKAKWDIERALKVIYTAYSRAGDYKSAFMYLEQNRAYADSLYNEERERGINALHLKQKQKENDDLYNQKAYNLTQLKMSNRVATIVAVLAILLLISKILIYYFYRQKSQLNKSLLRTSADILAQNDVITRQKEELEKINQTKDQLFTIIGHDLRGPFASILQAMDVMKSGGLSEVDLRHFLDNFHEKITSTALMLDNLVLWAENQRSGAKTLPAVLSVSKTVNQAIIIFDYLVREKNIEIQHETGGDLPVWADPDHVRVIIHNLIGNAVKFTPAKGLIRVFYSHSEDRVNVHIRDSGVGIPEEKINKLFNVSGKNITTYGTNNEKGVGIGLVLVKEFTEKNNARLQVQSEVGEGTEFTVSFPRARE